MDDVDTEIKILYLQDTYTDLDIKIDNFSDMDSRCMILYYSHILFMCKHKSTHIDSLVSPQLDDNDLVFLC